MYSVLFADYKSAILNLIKGEYWLEAYKLAKSKKRLGDVETCLKPELISASKRFISELNRIRDEIVKYSDRLNAIWKEKSSNDVIKDDTESTVSKETCVRVRSAIRPTRGGGGVAKETLAPPLRRNFYFKFLPVI